MKNKNNIVVLQVISHQSNVCTDMHPRNARKEHDNVLWFLHVVRDFDSPSFEATPLDN